MEKKKKKKKKSSKKAAKKSFRLSRKLMLFVGVVGLFVLFFGGLWTFQSSLPYNLYRQALEGGKVSDLYALKTRSGLIKGEIYKEPPAKGIFREDDTLWKKFHLANFTVPLPIHHPLLISVPLIEKDGPGLKIGMKFMDNKEKDIASFSMASEPVPFALGLESQKIFRLPIYHQYLLNLKVSDIWRDIFAKDLDLKSSDVKGLLSGRGVDHRELVYNLFILHLREKFMPKEMKTFAFWPERKIGVIKLEGEESDFGKEVYFVLERGLIHRFEFSTNKWSAVASAIRKRYLDTLEFRPSTAESSRTIYAAFQSLPFRKKIDQEGMTYLFSAWSHSQGKREFLREMIRLLERGERNHLQLGPLYQYASERFGTSFSRKDEILQKGENAEERLKRKIKEELNEEIESELGRSVSGEVQFENQKQKVDYYLKKAKEKGANEESNTLRMD